MDLMLNLYHEKRVFILFERCFVGDVSNMTVSCIVSVLERFLMFFMGFKSGLVVNIGILNTGLKADHPRPRGKKKPFEIKPTVPCSEKCYLHLVSEKASKVRDMTYD